MSQQVASETPVLIKKRVHAPQAHVPALDGVRGTAILLVLICHFCGGLDPLRYGRLFPALVEMSRAGVDLFFVLSGFLITGILLDAKGKRNYFLNFYVRRTLRIFPLYYGSLVVILIILPQFGYLIDAGRGVSKTGLWLYYSNFVMAHDATWTYAGLHLAHFWSLAIEEQFYLVWPLIVLLLTANSIMRACVIISIWALLTRIALLSAGVPPISVFLITQCRIDALLAGAFLAVLSRQDGGLQRHRRPILGVACVAFVMLFGLIFLQGKSVIFSHSMRYTFFALTFMGVVCAAVTSPATSPASRLFTSPVLRCLGKYSYGIYVFHAMLADSFASWFGPGILVRYMKWYLLAVGAYFLIASGISLAIAWVSWHLYEKQWLRLKKYFV